MMRSPVSEPRVLIYDLETSPNEGYTWGKWDQNVIRFSKDWHLLSVSWKWLGERKTYVLGLDDFEGYRPRDRDDSALAWLLHDLFDEADIAVTHNGNSFDQPKARTRMAVHHLPPHSPMLEVDTLKVARKHFAFTSNTLEDLCRQLGLDHKGKVDFPLWLGCMGVDEESNPISADECYKAWRKMKRYNAQDVRILEELYLTLRPWIDNHPNMALLADKPGACPRCQGGPLKSTGWRYYQVTRRRRFRCVECGAFCYGRTLEKLDVTHVR
jgi:RNase_H superfamily